MGSVILVAGTLCVLFLLVHLVTIAVVIRRVQRKQPTRIVPGSLTLVRPVCGIENFIEQTLASTFQLDHPHYDIIFCVAHANDPVLPLVQHLIAFHPRVPARILIGNDPISDNPKLNNMVKGWRAATGEWVIVADSNVMMPPDYAARLLTEWDNRTGIVCSPPIGSHPVGFWAELECAFLNGYQGRWQSFADSLGCAFAQGKTMLWRKDTLNAGGGMRALADELAEDAAATKLLNRMGLRARIVDRPFQQPLGFRSARQVWDRQLRWARLRRATFPLWFTPEVLNGSLPALITCWTAAEAADLPSGQIVVAFATVWYGAEALLAYAAGWHLSRWSPVAWLTRDLLLPAVWLGALTGNEFVWRGNSMRVAERGRAA